MGDYILKCLECGKEIPDKYTSSCPENHFSLLRADYKTKNFIIKNHQNIWKFSEWLPVQGISDVISAPITYKSENFAREFNLKNLYISFNGYWKEKNANIKTCTFKELEAPATFQRLHEKGNGKLVVASAGNTARAFAYIAILNNLPLILVVPKKNFDRLWLPIEPKNNIYLIAVKDADYSDAINVAKNICSVKGFISEGGAKNIARRDGMGIVLLDAVRKMKKLPEHYFQAIGSGTGAIGVYEMSIRILKDGRFGNHIPKLQLSQNLPFAPMHFAWVAKRNKIIPDLDMINSEKTISQMYSDVLSNRNPPYSIKGGVYDILNDTNGLVYGITKEEALIARKIYEETEGIDIVRPSAVAVASLIKAIESNNIDKNDSILLNITGGGVKRVKEEFGIHNIKPYNIIDKNANLEDLLFLQDI